MSLGELCGSVIDRYVYVLHAYRNVTCSIVIRDLGFDGIYVAQKDFENKEDIYDTLSFVNFRRV